MECVALGSKSSFSYNPTEEELKKYLGKVTKKGYAHFKDLVLTDEEKKEAFDALVDIENNQPIANKKTVGDASESGLIKFVEPILGLE